MSFTGFTWGSAITTDADLIVAEQQIENLLRGGQSFTNLHVDASNRIYRDLVGRGYDPATLDSKFFIAEARYDVLMQIFGALRQQGAQQKFDRYRALYLEEKKTRVYSTANTVRETRRVPLVDLGGPHRQWGVGSVPNDCLPPLNANPGNAWWWQVNRFPE